MLELLAIDFNPHLRDRYLLFDLQIFDPGNVSDGTPTLFAVDKATGETLAQVEAPADSSYGMMTYVHKDRQYIMLQTGPVLTAMALADY